MSTLVFSNFNVNADDNASLHSVEGCGRQSLMGSLVGITVKNSNPLTSSQVSIYTYLSPKRKDEIGWTILRKLSKLPCCHNVVKGDNLFFIFQFNFYVQKNIPLCFGDPQSPNPFPIIFFLTNNLNYWPVISEFGLIVFSSSFQLF